ncbi:MAG TPA: hypothetical protein VHA52_00725 [Candidatus Babeliaceae bacterium]|nr:hypothetical protein [Candidatus Babeliaceae bacterium]
MNMTQKPYSEQWHRVLRLGNKIDFDASNIDELIDDVVNFVINSWSLRDWLIKSGFDRSVIDDFINNNKHLVLCKDLANHQKHKELRDKSNNDFVVIANKNTPIGKSWDPFQQKETIVIREWNRGKPIDARQEINVIINAWQELITQLDR